MCVGEEKKEKGEDVCEREERVYGRERRECKHMCVEERGKEFINKCMCV